MNAHQLEKHKDRTVVPDFLALSNRGLESWEFPEWDDLEIPTRSEVFQEEGPLQLD